MSNNAPKLADVIPANVSREFNPSGWIDRHGVFHPQVNLRGLHWKSASVSIDAIVMIERNLPGLVAAAIEAATDPAVESAVRAEYARKSAAKVEPVKVETPKSDQVKTSPLAAAIAARNAK